MFIIFDIGGTNTRVSSSENGESFSEPKIFPTPKDFDDGIAAIVSAARKIADGKEIVAAGGGVAGPLDRARTMLVNSPHLPGWIGKPLVARLRDELNVPIYIDNDTAIVGLGEAVHGAGKGHEIVAYLTVSTGVGGVRIVNKKIDVSAMGFEPGHQIIDAGGGLNKVDQPTYPGVTFEAYVSGTSVETRYHKKPYEITDPVFWDEMARIFAYGLNNTIVHWSPDIVVIGGSMMKKIGIPIEAVQAYLRGILHIYAQLPIITKYQLGDIGGLYGAMHFVRSKINEQILR